MSDPKRIPFTAPVRRGLGLALIALGNGGVWNIKGDTHPDRSRIATAAERRAWDKAMDWMMQEAKKQAERDEARPTRTKKAAPAAESEVQA